MCFTPQKIQNSCLRKLNELLENMARQFTETRKTIHKSFFFFKFSKEIETVEKIQTEILKLKNTMNIIKSTNGSNKKKV